VLTPQQIRQFHEVGYLRGPKVLSDDEVETLREEVLRVIHDRDNPAVPQPVLCHNLLGPNSDKVVWQIVNIWQASRAFARCVTGETVSSLVAQLTGAAELGVWHDQIQYKPAGAGGVNMWHQDSPYWGILTPKHQQVTAWIALDDVDVDNGCMKMVPGSHHWGNTIEFLHTLKEFDDMEQVKEFQGHEVRVLACPVSKGEVHFHHSLTWHGSGLNKSGRPRRAVAIHYATDQTRYTGAGVHVMKQFVHVADGEKLEGEAFPLVWSKREMVIAE
jgi:ectoine hydroxylase-related dioxygenase (phytanoyl-CoA dioxygenase family)